MFREIEAAAGIPFTGIVNNSNIGKDTKLSDVIATDFLARELSDMAGVPLVMTCAEKSLCEDEENSDFFRLNLQKKLF